ncbi:MAG TPA: YihY/virulence factor BrkB family protein [Polyangiaceae bacterium]|nr:YihY/virulence factor BrkB family protein [Polyangiaceae bacterium]
MSFTQGKAFKVVKATASDFMDDNAPRLAAALAYYALLSLAPLVVLALAVAGLMLDEEAARGGIARELGNLVGSAGGQAVENIVKNAQAPAAGIISTVMGLVVLLFGASGVFGELEAALDTIWEVAPRPGRGILGMIRDRLFSFAMVMGVAFLLLVSLVVSAAVAAVGRFLSSALPGGEVMWQGLNFVISLGVVTALFAVMFKTVPHAKVAWRDVWVGAFVTALLFTLGKLLIGLYLGKTSFSSAYGAAGSLVLLVIWVYYSASILLLGAEFTQAYAIYYGSRIEPSEDAIRAERPRNASLTERRS